jgi:biopolymer transport protein ExbD
MKNTLKALVVLSALMITTVIFAQTKASNLANYKQQNQLLGRKQTASAQVQLNNDYSTNPQANHRNYKTQGLQESPSKTFVVTVKNDDKHQNYKQKNLLTKRGRDARNKKMNKSDSILISQNQLNKKE